MLEEKPSYAINSKTAFESEATADLALAGCYGYLTTYNSYGQALAEVMVGASGIGWAQTNGGDQDLYASLKAPATNGLINLVWSGWYKVIGQCNFFINSVEQSELSETYKKRAIAEARFLRGLSYYNLAFVFGGVPLRNEPVASGTIKTGRASREAVIQQVEKDWQAAAAGLATRAELGNEAAGRATRYAAFAYLAKLYFMLGSNDNTPSSPYWVKAKEMGDSVIASGGYALEPRFATLFASHSAGSPESIFQVNFSTTSAYTGNRGSWVFSPPNATTGISWGRVRVTKSFYDQFRGSYPDDPRLKSTFGTDWVQIKTNNQRIFSYPYTRKNAGTAGAPVYVVSDSINYAALANPVNPALTEISTEITNNFVTRAGDHQGWPYFIKQMDPASTAQNSNKNVMVYRYADFLLLMADVENELGNTGNAITYMNMVLKRARTSGTSAASYPQDLQAGILQDELRRRIFRERLFEMAGEYEMYIDVRRRGAEWLGMVVNWNNQHHITRAFVEHAKNTNNNTAFRDRLLPATADELKKNLLLPIPQEEINTNEELTAADQNFGY